MQTSLPDSLTLLPTNSDFRLALETIAAQPTPWGVLVIGIDGFKRVNSLYSYAFGDRVLQAFALAVRASLSAGMKLFRLDGDCFGILCKTPAPGELDSCFHTLRQIAGHQLTIDTVAIPFAVSGGICRYPLDGQDGETLYRNAHVALMASKEKGGGRCTVCSSLLLQKTRCAMRLREALHKSVTNDFQGFRLNYQPLVLARTGRLYGCEVLLRWQHPDFPEGVSPPEFIPVLEGAGMILAVGRWVLRTALRQCGEWKRVMPDFQMSINVSSAQFEDPDFKYYVMDMLAEYDINPCLITLELTESGKISNVETVRHVFDFLRGQGLKIAFDDFGTGYATLDIFRQLSADELKIDRSFLERISYDVTDQKIIAQIIRLCDSMNMYVCVEGIETFETEEIVKQLGPRLLQGYYYNKPMESDAFFTHYLENAPAPLTTPEKIADPFYSPFRPAQAMSMEKVVENACAGIFQVELDGDFTFLTCNEGYRRMVGYTAREMEEKFQSKVISLAHPDDVEHLKAEVHRQLGVGDTVLLQFRVMRSDGEALPVIGTGNLVRSRHGAPTLAVVVLPRISELLPGVRREPRYDLLTGLLNKTGFAQEIDRHLAGLSAQTPAALYLLDLDSFKALNGRHGHLFGDEVLREVACRLTAFFGEKSLVARVGGDSFMGLADLAEPLSDAQQLEGALTDLLRPVFSFGDKSCTVRAAIVIASCPQDGSSFQELYQYICRNLSRLKEKNRDPAISR